MLVMKNKTRFELTYIDGFAGAGTVKVRGSGDDGQDILTGLDPSDLLAQEEFIAGSPRRALELQPGFKRHFFFDLDPVRAELLESLSEEYPEKKLVVRCGDANHYIQMLAPKLEPWNQKAVAFLDPYGAHLHWRTVEALGRTGNVDVIINLPIAMAINRLLQKDGTVSDKAKQQLDDCFGCNDWYDLVYHQPEDLFGSQLGKREQAERLLLELYTDRLKSVFKAVSKPSLIRNTRKGPLYYLIWAGHPTGLGIANHILTLGEKISLPRTRRR